MLRKFLLSAALVSVLTITAIVPAVTTQAAALPIADSIGSDAANIATGKDTTQDKVTEYYADIPVATETYSADSAVAVYATKGSMLKIQTPKTIILGANGSGKSTLFEVFGFLLLNNFPTIFPISTKSMVFVVIYQAHKP